MSALRLCLVTSRIYSEREFVTQVIRAVEGGVTSVQLRDTGVDDRTTLRTARLLKRILPVPLIINNRADIAAVVGAGVHLGQRDLPWQEARKLLGAEALIGLSVETIEQVLEAEEADVNYLGVSALFSSQTKSDCRTQWGLKGLRRVRALSRHPLMPIGGINLDNIKLVSGELRHGDGIAMVGELWRAKDPAAYARKVQEQLNALY